ncbi:hypothetical protein EJ03DRAFT_377167 [Teratosphaeria nubilosa]|uniref:Uncharacterized protein n=1 Tax=Teratosphaeria nubilosa TaxID=161662 RepID=A0A6G1L1E0_9PEZI|nr:hypothetical protein EJ03DRAFT_377167 [Teratosphaeria nubilosa]
MCCHRLYIYDTCGHSAFSPEPLIMCRHAAIPPDGTHSTTCEIIAHPYQSWRLDSLCSSCQVRRHSMLTRIERNQLVEFDEWKWKVSYALPIHGKDYWTTKMENLRMEQEKTSLASARREKRRSRMSVNWKRLSRKKGAKSSTPNG